MCVPAYVTGTPNAPQAVAYDPSVNDGTHSVQGDSSMCVYIHTYMVVFVCAFVVGGHEGRVETQSAALHHATNGRPSARTAGAL